MSMRALVLFFGLSIALFACSSDEANTVDDTSAQEQESDDVEAGGEEAADGDSADEDDPSVDLTSQELMWSGCGNDLECTTVLAPLDYEAPTGATVELAITRALAGNPDARIGNLFVNPGGPGSPAELLVNGLANFGPPELGESFDIIGIDPRGTGGSNAIDCNSNWIEDINTPLTIEDGLADDVDAFLADFGAMAAECEEEHSIEYLASITTENAARDHEFVRILLGDEPMNFFGASYGTTLGSVYATMFPGNIRALVLDAPVLPDDGLVGREHLPDLELQIARLDASCDAWVDCPVGNQGWLNALDDLEEQLIEGPIGPLTLGEFSTVVSLTIPAPSFFPDVAFGVAEALDGNGGPLAELNGFFLTPLPETGNPAEFAGGFAAIECADGVAWDFVPSQDTLTVGEETLAEAPEAGPFFGLPCDLWPVQGDGLPSIDYRGDAPVLIIGNTGDAITPLRWAEAMVEDFGDAARLLTWDATGHVAYSFGSQCIDAHTTTFFLSVELPPEGTVCDTVSSSDLPPWELWRLAE